MHNLNNQNSTLLISDIHLGCRSSRIKSLKRLLLNKDYSRLIIVGDLINDKKRLSLSLAEIDILSTIRDLKKHNIEVVWVSGNHDRWLDSQIEFLTDAKAVDEYIWEVGNKKFIAIHGDSFEKRLTENSIVKVFLSPIQYGFTLVDKHNTHLAKLSEYAYAKLSGLSYVVARGALKYAEANNADVIFCGHTHDAMRKEIIHSESGKKITYYNIGSWTKSPFQATYVNHDGGVTIKTFFDKI